MEPEVGLSDAEEQAKHVFAIQSLSEQFHLPAVTVAEVYERELADIRRDALITTYLPIFVTRRVTAVFRQISLSVDRFPGGGASAGPAR